MVRFCRSSAEDTGPPSVIPTPLPSSAPPGPRLVIIVVMVLAGQLPAITALRRRACDMFGIILLLFPLTTLFQDLSLPCHSPTFPVTMLIHAFYRSHLIARSGGIDTRKSRAHYTSAVLTVTADARRGKGGNTHVPELCDAVGFDSSGTPPGSRFARRRDASKVGDDNDDPREYESP